MITSRKGSSLKTLLIPRRNTLHAFVNVSAPTF